ncbi:MAG: hypothetical protein ACK56I_24200, partial [bacterium]
VGVDHGPPALGSGPEVRSQHPKHRRQPEHERPAVGIGVEGCAVLFHVVRHAAERRGELRRQFHCRPLRRRHRVEFHVDRVAEMQRQGRGPDRVAEEYGQRGHEPRQRPGQHAAAVMDEIVGRAQE